MYFYQVISDFDVYRRGHLIASQRELTEEVDAGNLMEVKDPGTPVTVVRGQGTGTYKLTPEARRRLGYHPVIGPSQQALYEQNRKLFMELFSCIENSYDNSRERSLSLTALQESLMWLNAHVACNGVEA